MNDFAFQRAVPEDADAVFALYQSLVGTPFCAWDATYPAPEHVHDDIAAGALYTRLFLTHLLVEAARRDYDCMRILVAKTNLPAISLYRRIGADFRGEAFSYGIHWFCAQVPCRE